MFKTIKSELLFLLDKMIYKKFEPVLVYLVETSNGYIPNRGNYFTSGVTVWAEENVQYRTYKDAKKVADEVGGKVIKLRVSAVQEKICGN